MNGLVVVNRLGELWLKSCLMGLSDIWNITVRVEGVVTSLLRSDVGTSPVSHLFFYVAKTVVNISRFLLVAVLLCCWS